MSENMEKLVKQRMTQKLSKYDEMNFHDPAVVVIVSSEVILELAEIQDKYVQFDGDFDFDYDPEPYMTIKWWLNGVTRTENEIKFRFDPLRVESEGNDVYAAYNRAMSIL